MTSADVVGTRADAKLYSACTVILAILYGMALASLPVDVFLDRSSYLAYADSAPLILFGYLQAGWLSVLTNEPLWLGINAGLALWLEPSTVLRVLIFASAATVAHAVLRTGPRHFIWLLLILFFPNVIKNHIIHLRQGLAVALFMAAWHTSGSVWRILLFTLTPLIHASFFFVVLLLMLTDIIHRLKLAADLRFIAYALVGLGVASGLGTVATLLGARQTDYLEFTAAEISGLGFAFWFVVLAIFATARKEFLRRHAFAIGAITFYLASYFFIEVAARIFESALIVVLLAGLDLSGWRLWLYLAAIFCFAAISWIIRVGQPWLGFGLT